MDENHASSGTLVVIKDPAQADRPPAKATRLPLVPERVDIVTGQIVTSDDRNFLLTAFSGNSPRPDFNLSSRPCSA